MQLMELITISNGIYKPKKIPNDNLKLTVKEVLSKPEKLILAARFCDGTYHQVNSKIKQIFKI